MQITEYDDVNEILEILLSRIRLVLGNKLVGLYLDGSLVIGDFEPDISDIDLITAISSELNNEEFEAVKKMHDKFVEEHKEWFDRIEVCYITVEALKKVRTQTAMIVNISPGEPINRKESNREWLMNWYLAREKSKALYGPSPKEIIEPISKVEFIQTIKTHANSWNKYVETMRNPYAQSYAILSMCRALYTVKNGEQVSKKKAALWVEQEYPELTKDIQNALMWRHSGKYNPPNDVTHVKTVAFVNRLRELILAE